MPEVDMTKLSRRGQVVIPKEIRKELNLKEGEKLLVIGIDNTIVLRRVLLTKEEMRLKNLLRKTRVKAEKIGFSKEEVDEMIRKHRKGKE